MLIRTMLALAPLVLLSRLTAAPPLDGGNPPAQPDPNPDPAAPNPPAEATKTEPGAAAQEHMIPKSRFDEINRSKQEAEAEATRLRQVILDRENADREAAAEKDRLEREAAAERAAAETRAEEEEAERQREWQKLADKRERQIADRDRRVTELETQLALAQAESRARAASNETEVQTRVEQVSRYATLLNEQIDAETASWPDEVRNLDPGATSLEQRMSWLKQARPLAARFAQLATPPGNQRPPRPETPQQPNGGGGGAGDTEQKKLRGTGSYVL